MQLEKTHQSTSVDRTIQLQGTKGKSLPSVPVLQGNWFDRFMGKKSAVSPPRTKDRSMQIANEIKEKKNSTQEQLEAKRIKNEHYQKNDPKKHFFNSLARPMGQMLSSAGAEYFEYTHDEEKKNFDAKDSRQKVKISNLAKKAENFETYENLMSGKSDYFKTQGEDQIG